MAGSFLKAPWPLTFIQGVLSTQTVSRLRTHWGSMILFLWFKLDFCSLDLEIFYLSIWSKNLVGFHILTFRNTMINDPMPKVSVSQTTIAVLTLLAITGAMPTLPQATECRHFALATPRSSYPHWILFSQFRNSSSHCIFWPTGKSDQKALQGCWCPPHKFISWSHGERCAFCPLLEWVNRS